MNCIKIYDLASALVNYYDKINNHKSSIKIINKLSSEKLNEELFLIEEIPYIKIYKDIFVINRQKNYNLNKKEIKNLEKFRVSNFNFMSEKDIIKYLKKIEILH